MNYGKAILCTGAAAGVCLLGIKLYSRYVDGSLRGYGVSASGSLLNRRRLLKFIQEDERRVSEILPASDV
jgi:hypothetical protein